MRAGDDQDKEFHKISPPNSEETADAGLPIEVWYLILNNLSVRDLVALSEVNTLLNQITHAESFLGTIATPNNIEDMSKQEKWQWAVSTFYLPLLRHFIEQRLQEGNVMNVADLGYTHWSQMVSAFNISVNKAERLIDLLARYGISLSDGGPQGSNRFVQKAISLANYQVLIALLNRGASLHTGNAPETKHLLRLIVPQKNDLVRNSFTVNAILEDEKSKQHRFMLAIRSGKFSVFKEFVECCMLKSNPIRLNTLYNTDTLGITSILNYAISSCAQPNQNSSGDDHDICKFIINMFLDQLEDAIRAKNYATIHYTLVCMRLSARNEINLYGDESYNANTATGNYLSDFFEIERIHRIIAAIPEYSPIYPLNELLKFLRDILTEMNQKHTKAQANFKHKKDMKRGRGFFEQQEDSPLKRLCIYGEDHMNDSHNEGPVDDEETKNEPTEEELARMGIIIGPIMNMGDDQVNYFYEFEDHLENNEAPSPNRIIIHEIGNSEEDETPVTPYPLGHLNIVGWFNPTS